MDDKYAKEIARELKLIRKELQKSNQMTEPKGIKLDGEEAAKTMEEHQEHQPSAGERVTIK